MRRLGSGKLVIATHNAGKLREISALLAPYGMECISAGALGLPEPAETGTTFVENALIKARAAAEAARKAVEEIEAAGGAWSFAKLTIANAALRELAMAGEK